MHIYQSVDLVENLQKKKTCREGPRLHDFAQFAWPYPGRRFQLNNWAESLASKNFPYTLYDHIL